MEGSFKLLHCHNLEGIGEICALCDNPNRFIFLQMDLSPAKLYDFNLTTVPLTAKQEVPIEESFPKGEDTSLIIWDAQLEGKPAKALFVW